MTLNTVTSRRGWQTTCVSVFVVAIGTSPAVCDIITTSGDTRIATFSSFLGGSGDVIHVFDGAQSDDAISLFASGPTNAVISASGLANIGGTGDLILSANGEIFGDIQDRVRHLVSWTFLTQNPMQIAVAAQLDSLDTGNPNAQNHIESRLNLSFLDLTSGVSLHNAALSQRDALAVAFSDGFTFDLLENHQYTLSFFAQIHDWRGANSRGIMSDSFDVDFTPIAAPVPAPGAAFLGVIGFGMVGWFKRQML